MLQTRRNMYARKTKNAAPADARLPNIQKELLDQVVTGPMTTPAAMRKFNKAVIVRVMGAETNRH
jgi:hypothetical protein